jgi:hypothetical protein
MPAALLRRDCGSRQCACCRPNPRRLASAPGSRSRGRAATLVNADLAAGPDETEQRPGVAPTPASAYARTAQATTSTAATRTSAPSPQQPRNPDFWFRRERATPYRGTLPPVLGRGSSNWCACSLGVLPSLSRRADCLSPGNGGAHAGGGVAVEKDDHPLRGLTLGCLVSSLEAEVIGSDLQPDSAPEMPGEATARAPYRERFHVSRALMASPQDGFGHKLRSARTYVRPP